MPAGLLGAPRGESTSHTVCHLLPAATTSPLFPGRQDDFSTKSEQYKFLQRELKNVNRKRTPWLVVVMHAPFYSSFTKHYKEPECMRQTYEPLMNKYGVDFVLSGHDHA